MFSIFTDTSANLDTQWLSKRQVQAVPFHYIIENDDQTCMDTRSFDGKTFYDAMRAGRKVMTSQISSQAFLDAFTPVLAEGRNILYVGMSSGISGAYAQACIATEELKENFPERKILLVDTLAASLGEGLLVLLATEYRAQGLSVDAAYDLLQQQRMQMCQVFTVDDLKYLRATGRLSNAAAIVGSLLGIKPLLKGNTEGRIINFSNLRGRKKAIAAMAEEYHRTVQHPEEQIIGIAHADCADDAEYLSNLLRAQKPPKDIMTVMYEPVTGSHVGPGTLALFFLGDESFRAEKAAFAALNRRLDSGREKLKSGITEIHSAISKTVSKDK